MEKCSFEPELLKGAAGMFHCPVCGEMVLAGIAHPDYSVVYKSLGEIYEQARI